MAATVLLQPIANAKIIHAPWVLRLALAQIQKVYDTIETSTARIGVALKELDPLPNNNQPRLFQLRTESELWADRPSAYDYMV